MMQRINHGFSMIVAFALLSFQASLAQTSTTPQFLQVDWQYDAKSPLNATVGDTIQFTWPTSSYHDVFIHPSGNCDNKTGAIPIYPYATVGGSVNYTFTVADAAPEGKPVFFACEVGDGIHCRFNVNQMVIVYLGDASMSPTMVPGTTSIPTATPTMNALPTTAAPSPAPVLSSGTTTPNGSLVPSMVPTIDAQSVNGSTAFPTASPTVFVNATASPSALPIFQTTPPTIPDPSLAPTQQASAAPSSVILLSSPPSLPPSFSKAPSSSPSIAPSGAPSIATPSPTTSVRKTSLEGLEMTLYGTTSLSAEDITNWESVTSLYQTSYYADGKSGVLDLETTLKVTNTTRRRLDRWLQDGTNNNASVTLIYNQNMTYRLSDAALTPALIVSIPFSTEESRTEYVNLYLNNVGDTSALTAVTTVSPIEGDAVESTSTPAPSEDNNNNEEEQLKKNDGGLSGGAIAGIVIASLVACVLCCLLTAQRHERENEWDEEEENPYIPPSPASFENYGASNKSVEHSFFQE